MQMKETVGTSIFGMNKFYHVCIESILSRSLSMTCVMAFMALIAGSQIRFTAVTDSMYVLVPG